jgi:ribosomal protection tetracycline resistance protein
VTLLPCASGEEASPVRGTVFKIERGPAGEKVAYLRMTSGTLRTRDRMHYGRDSDAKVTAIAVFERGPAVQRPSVSAGGIAKVWGLHGVRIGDRVGEPGTDTAAQHFPPPALEAVIDPVDSDERARLRVALEQLAEQDPLIAVRQDDARRELSVSLYGDVQKEVIQATLASDYGIDVVFREVTPIYVERPVGTGEAVEVLHAESNPYLATIGLRVEPAPDDSGVEFAADVDPRAAPLYLYKTFESFVERMAEYVCETLRRGPLGWRVTDCLVTMTSCAYSIPDGPPSRRGPPSTAADFRKLTPLVLMQSLAEAGTVLCEPVVRVTLEIPTDAIGAVTAALVRAGAPPATPDPRGKLTIVETVVSAVRAQELQRQLPALTRGEGVLDSTFAGHRPVAVQKEARDR